MIRISEMVLPGHPDKFCDQVADAVIAECVAIDPDPMVRWRCRPGLTRCGSRAACAPAGRLAKPMRDIVVETGLALGYVPGNHIDATRYQVTSTVCQRIDDPSQWSRYVNDQSVVIGWAGYDAKVRYLPPEHFFAHALREALLHSCRDGLLAGQGPDGKLMVRLREEGRRWTLEHVLVTLQQRDAAAFMEVCRAIARVLEDGYVRLRDDNPRWTAPWDEVELMLNPNGPMVHAGSDGDNGQTGRKLAMDFYGPRIPIGGGALSGKHLTHIDRIGAYAAREAALRAVRSGASECLVRLAWAPNRPEPLDICYDMAGRGRREAGGFFHHGTLAERYDPGAITGALARGGHFYDVSMPWNGLGAKASAVRGTVPDVESRRATSRHQGNQTEVRVQARSVRGVAPFS
jgi:S-adenosylmethionine synthetase